MSAEKSGRSSPRIVVIGAGPTGLGAAHRLQELGHDDFVVLEANAEVGGLARSVVDDAGFTFDIGGHVLFSHYGYYDRVVDRRCARASPRSCATPGSGPRTVRPVPLPEQHQGPRARHRARVHHGPGRGAARRVPVADELLGVDGADLRRRDHEALHAPVQLQGVGDARRAHGLRLDRRAGVGGRSRGGGSHVVYDEAPAPWGPNDQFRYPLRGGTGTLCTRISEPLLDRIVFGCVVTSVDLGERCVRTEDGRSWPYDHCSRRARSTSSSRVTEPVPDAVRSAAGDLIWSGSHIVGIGIDRPAASAKNWVYFPEPDVPFYRVTYLSNYSPYMTPAPDQTLFLAETSWSRFRQSDAATIVDDVIDGLVRSGLMTDDDRDLVLTTWRCSPDMTYPVPTIGRNAALDVVQPWLQEHDVSSRGRFGAWLYEIGNMDHSFMQGVEWVDHVLSGEPETTWRPAIRPATECGGPPPFWRQSDTETVVVCDAKTKGGSAELLLPVGVAHHLGVRGAVLAPESAEATAGCASPCEHAGEELEEPAPVTARDEAVCVPCRRWYRIARCPGDAPSTRCWIGTARSARGRASRVRGDRRATPLTPRRRCSRATPW